MDPVDGMRSVRRRLSDPVESLAQAVAERAIDLVLRSVDINAVLRRVDIDDLLGRIDVNKLLEQVDVDRLLERVDVNSIATRVDVDALVEQTDLGSVIARSSSSVASSAVDVVRSQAFGLDELIARAVAWVLRREYHGSLGLFALLQPGAPGAAGPGLPGTAGPGGAPAAVGP
ncbi:MAG TPA: hypothetical protein VH641_07300 [Streptosporangiaceae bacterium]